MTKMKLQEVISSMVDNINQTCHMTNDDNNNDSNNCLKLLELDITISGGAFNANYLVGCLYFLREMQRKNKICIRRLSSCSVSSLIAFLFLTNNLELFQEKIYEMAVTSFRNNKFFIFTESTLENIISTIKCSLHGDDATTLELINKKLYITYFDVKRCRKIVKKQYKSVNEVFETIKKSCYIPFVTMNNLLYKNRYMDGCTPYIFENSNRKQLFISMLGKDKIKESIVLKNDKNGTHKIISGILDTYYFFHRGCRETSMCSYTDNWGFLKNIKYKFFHIVSFLFCYLFYFFNFYLKFPSLSSCLHSKSSNSNSIEIKIFMFILSILKTIFNIFIEHYCL